MTVYELALWLADAIGLLALVWIISWGVSALRREGDPPDDLYWAPDIPVRHTDVGDTRLRHVVTGEGPPLVLLHTLRTQLDLFQRVLGDLAEEYRVYAFDHPGHGWSGTPRADYTPALFLEHLRGFLDRRQLEDVSLVGESIGAPIALQLASEEPDRVRKVVAINSYDYDRGRGIERGSTLSRVLFPLARIPVVGETVWRLRFYRLFAEVLKGSVHEEAALPEELVRQMYAAGTQPRRYRAFLSLIRHFPEWEAVRAAYPDVPVPVLLLYGEHDWSRPAERRRTEEVLPHAERRTVPGAGHLLSLEKPAAMVRETTRFLSADEES